LLVVALVGVLVFNPFNSNTSLDNGMIGTVNKTGNNNTTTGGILPSHLSTVDALFISSSQGALVTTNPTTSFTPSYLDTILVKFDIYVQKFF